MTSKTSTCVRWVLSRMFLGFAIFYLRELQGQNASVIYPFTRGYAPATAEGLRRTWQFRVEL